MLLLFWVLWTVFEWGFRVHRWTFGNEKQYHTCKKRSIFSYVNHGFIGKACVIMFRWDLVDENEFICVICLFHESIGYTRILMPSKDLCVCVLPFLICSCQWGHKYPCVCMLLCTFLQLRGLCDLWEKGCRGSSSSL